MFGDAFDRIACDVFNSNAVFVTSVFIDVVHPCGGELNQLEFGELRDNFGGKFNFIGDDNIRILATLNDDFGVIGRLRIDLIVAFVCSTRHSLTLRAKRWALLAMVRLANGLGKLPKSLV